MNSGKEIEHSGIITAIRGDLVWVKIISESACAACHARGSCMAADMQEKEIEVKGGGLSLTTGEEIGLIMSLSQGFKAVFLGYLLPFLILFTGLILFDMVGMNELTSGLLAIGLMPPYYLIIYFLRDKIRKDFVFSIRKKIQP